MKQEKIKYSDIIALGFNETPCNDSVYFDYFGYKYVIIDFNLTKKIYLQWHKDTGFCEMVRIDNKRDCNILGRVQMHSLESVKAIIEFYNKKK